ncbi:hypothetical protein PHLGIDRAFT_17170 [Phlebiopsis gigantea 11061_1 CR5-6]|uniref:Uncharacterized protein n=1 Tax=Phlebiopsis gigantea (strain 11061_1 CR5-6) TaxID=745531 RepID=A0A0C3RYW0_PHLG1|nr:hypothetical protein PHLGIDRAFT_17170 [Phlebiopsis gigantea 11061_1 CR5-6]
MADDDDESGPHGVIRRERTTPPSTPPLEPAADTWSFGSPAVTASGASASPFGRFSPPSFTPLSITPLRDQFTPISLPPRAASTSNTGSIAPVTSATRVDTPLAVASPGAASRVITPASVRSPGTAFRLNTLASATASHAAARFNTPVSVTSTPAASRSNTPMPTDAFPPAASRSNASRAAASRSDTLASYASTAQDSDHTPQPSNDSSGDDSSSQGSDEDPDRDEILYILFARRMEGPANSTAIWQYYGQFRHFEPGWADVATSTDGRCDRCIDAFWAHVESGGLSQAAAAELLFPGEAMEASGEWTPSFTETYYWSRNARPDA